MKKLFYFLPALLLAACGGGASSTNNDSANTEQETEAVVENPADTFSYKGYDMLAKVLAGKQPSDSSFLKEVTASKSFATHCSVMSEKWQTYKTNQVDKISEWSKQNFVPQPDTVFYPFGGPDFNYLASFFPEVKYSMLIGIEKPGKLPLADSRSWQRSDSLFRAIRSSVSNNLSASFFVTSFMQKDLNNELQGTLPVILMFMGLHGYDVITVNPVKLTDEGTVEYTDPDKVWAHTLDKKFDQGFEILYREPGETGARSLVYLCTDLSNAGFNKKNMSRLISDKFKGKTTFLKAASYLMMNGDFSEIRKAILDNSAMVATGPSGMPYKHFDKTKWDVTLYGEYCNPIKLFSQMVQPELRDAYSQQEHKPIPFRYDYGRGTSFYVGRKK